MQVDCAEETSKESRHELLQQLEDSIKFVQDEISVLRNNEEITAATEMKILDIATYAIPEEKFNLLSGIKFPAPLSKDFLSSYKTAINDLREKATEESTPVNEDDDVDQEKKADLSVEQVKDSSMDVSQNGKTVELSMSTVEDQGEPLDASVRDGAENGEIEEESKQNPSDNKIKGESVVEHENEAPDKLSWGSRENSSFNEDMATDLLSFMEEYDSYELVVKENLTASSNILKTPISIKDIQSKIIEMEYTSFDQLVRDVALLFNNLLVYYKGIDAEKHAQISEFFKECKEKIRQISPSIMLEAQDSDDGDFTDNKSATDQVSSRTRNKQSPRQKTSVPDRSNLREESIASEDLAGDALSKEEDRNENRPTRKSSRRIHRPTRLDSPLAGNTTRPPVAEKKTEEQEKEHERVEHNENENENDSANDEDIETGVETPNEEIVVKSSRRKSRSLRQTPPRKKTATPPEKKHEKKASVEKKSTPAVTPRRTSKRAAALRQKQKALTPKAGKKNTKRDDTGEESVDE